jgi:hypothetical protein
LVHPTSLLTVALRYELEVSPTGATAGAMSQAAENLLATLPADQRASLRFGFDDPGRRVWHYTPGRRRGVSLAEMNRGSAKAVHQLLTTVVSRPAHTRVSAITGLEDILDESEGGPRGAGSVPRIARGAGDAPRLEGGRHAGDYWTAAFGEPGAAIWGWRFEGHHVSINVTVADGAISSTPFFLGANPATVTDEGGRTVSRPLAPEDDLAVALLASLDPGQTARAVVSHEAPPDILSGDAVDVASVAALDQPVGLPGTAMRPDQVSLLRSLAAAYVNRLAAALADPVLARLDRDLPAFSFTWAGPVAPAPGQPHYYRLEGPRFLVEFDNRQNGANHVHSVWREPGGDFGARLLPEGLRHLS